MRTHLSSIIVVFEIQQPRSIAIIDRQLMTTEVGGKGSLDRE